MKIAIPSIVNNPTINSEIAECPISARSLVVYDLVKETLEIIRVEHIPNQPCANIAQLEEMGVDAFVSGICCKEHFATFRDHGIEVYQCNSSKVRDMIQGFVLGGAFIKVHGDDMTHEQLV